MRSGKRKWRDDGTLEDDPPTLTLYQYNQYTGDLLSHHMPPRPGQPPPQQGPQPLPGVGAIVAVGSGKGGVGKTTLAVNLALALAKLGHKTGLLDADVYGPNVPLMLGTSAQPRVLGENRIEPLQSYGVKIIAVGFLNPGDKPLVWRGPMLHSIIRQLLQLLLTRCTGAHQRREHQNQGDRIQAQHGDHRDFQFPARGFQISHYFLLPGALGTYSAVMLNSTLSPGTWALV